MTSKDLDDVTLNRQYKCTEVGGASFEVHCSKSIEKSEVIQKSYMYTQVE